MNPEMHLQKGALKRKKLSDHRIPAVKVEFEKPSITDNEMLEKSIKIIRRLKKLQKKD